MPTPPPAATPPIRPPPRRLDGLLQLALAALAFALYLPTLDAGFVHDDHLAIEANPAVREPTVTGVLATGFWGPAEADRIATWRPLVTATFALDAALGRLGSAAGGEPAAALDPAPFHATNVLLWALLVALLWRLAAALDLGPRARLLGVLLFAVHPLASEAVASLVGRADVLVAVAGVGYLLAVVRRRPLLATAWLAAGLLCKETAVVLPLVAATWGLARQWREHLLASGRAPDRLPDPAQAWRRGLAELRQVPAFARKVASALAAGRVRSLPEPLPWRPLLLGHAAVLVAWLAARWAVLGTLTGPAPSVVENPVVDAGLGGRLVAALHVAWLGARKLLLDGELSSDYGLGHFPPLQAGPEAAGGWAVIALLAVGLWLAARRSPRVALALGLIAAPLLLFSHLLAPMPTAFAERLWLLPLAGLCLLAGLGIDRALDVPLRLTPALYAGYAVLVALCLASTWLRLPDWRDDAAVFEAMARSAPGSYRANVNGAAAALERGDLALARQRLQRAVAVHDASPMAHLSLARLEAAAGEPAAAAAWLEKAKARGGVTDDWLAAACTVAVRFAPPAEAVDRCQRAETAARRSLRPPDPTLVVFHGMALDRAGQTEAAAARMQAALELGGARGLPTQALFNAGIFYARHGQDDRALALLRAAEARQPGQESVRRPLVAVCARIVQRFEASPPTTPEDRRLLQAAQAVLQRLLGPAA